MPALTDADNRRIRVLTWEAAGVAVAVISLLVAVVYSGPHLRATKQAMQLQLMTDVEAQVNESLSGLWKHENELILVETSQRRYLSSGTRGEVERAFAYMEYAAWLFESRSVDFRPALEFFGPNLACRYEHVLLPTGGGARAVAENYPNLTQFVRAYRPCRE
jgi:hypothetical protein